MEKKSWYPQDKEELNSLLSHFIGKRQEKKIHGIIVPHAGYSYSGKIAGKAFSILPKKEKAIILAPSHYRAFAGIASLKKIKTPLGEMKITPNDFEKLDYEHAIDNQIPFLQKLGFKEVLPLVVGEINENDALRIAQIILKHDALLIISTDLSHFLPYNNAIKQDKETIKIIENLDFENYEKIDACGKFPLAILMQICKIKKWKPKLIEYKNSGDITGDKSQVVGYASFEF
jgi:hypothetical protein